jgi:hypothetical protein
VGVPLQGRRGADHAEDAGSSSREVAGRIHKIRSPHVTDLQGSCRSGPQLSLRSGQCGDLILVAGYRVVRGSDIFDAEI